LALLLSHTLEHFLSMHRRLAWRIDADADLISHPANHGLSNVVADHQAFADAVPT